MFSSRFARLDLTEVVGSTAFMTGGREHHWVRLEEGNGQGVKRIGYEVTGEESFGQVRDELKSWNIEFDEGGNPAADRVSRWLRWTDPRGTNSGLYSVRYQRFVAAFACEREMGRFSHDRWDGGE